MLAKSKVNSFLPLCQLRVCGQDVVSLIICKAILLMQQLSKTALCPSSK